MTHASHRVFVDGTHVLIAGVTGAGDGFGGKSAVSAWWLDAGVEKGQFDYGVAFSPKPNRYPGAPSVGTVDEAAHAVAQGNRTLEWNPDVSIDDMSGVADAHARAVAFAEGLDGNTLVVHDDAVTYANADSLSYATALAGNPTGDKGGVKSLVVTQDPWDLPRKSVRSNLPVLVWVGPLTRDARNFFQSMQMSEAYDEIQERHTEPFMWSVIDGDGTVATFEGVDEYYA